MRVDLALVHLCAVCRSFAATAASAETLYVCGGVSADKTALSDAFRLECERSGDSVTWRWRRLPDVPVARVHAAAAVAGGRVHVVGGMVGECTLPEAGESVLVLHEEGMWEEAAVEGDAGGALCAARCVTLRILHSPSTLCLPPPPSP